MLRDGLYTTCTLLGFLVAQWVSGSLHAAWSSSHINPSHHLSPCAELKISGKAGTQREAATLPDIDHTCWQNDAALQKCYTDRTTLTDTYLAPIPSFHFIQISSLQGASDQGLSTLSNPLKASGYIN